jgi:hypothetical protein
MIHESCYLLHICTVDQANLSRALFGRAGRLRLARWMVENVPVGKYFYQSEARDGTGDVINEVRANLANFELLGLITRAHRDPGSGRRQYYQRLKNPIWTIFETALGLPNGVPVSRERRVG